LSCRHQAVGTLSRCAERLSAVTWWRGHFVALNPRLDNYWHEPTRSRLPERRMKIPAGAPSALLTLLPTLKSRVGIEIEAPTCQSAQPECWGSGHHRSEDSVLRRRVSSSDLFYSFWDDVTLLGRGQICSGALVSSNRSLREAIDHRGPLSHRVWAEG